MSPRENETAGETERGLVETTQTEEVPEEPQAEETQDKDI